MAQQEVIAAGRKSFSKIRSHNEVVFEDWENVIRALKIGRDRAMRVAGIQQGEKPAGKKYSNAFSEWLNENKWSHSDGGPGPTTRAACLKCADHLVAVTRWRNAQIQDDPDKALMLDHPQKVWARFNAATKTEGVKRKLKKVVIDPEKLAEQFGMLEDVDQATVIADVLQGFDTSVVTRILDAACSEDTLVAIAADISRDLKQTIMLRAGEAPQAVVNVILHECGYGREQVRETIAALEAALPDIPDVAVPATPKGRGRKAATAKPAPPPETVEPVPDATPPDEPAVTSTTPA